MKTTKEMRERWVEAMSSGENLTMTVCHALISDVDSALASAEAWKARAERAEVRATDQALLQFVMAKFIITSFAQPDHRMPTMDHACSRCIPGGPIVVPGFVCARHIAEGLWAAAEAAAARPEGKEPGGGE